MIGGKSTEKLLTLRDMINDLPQDRLKSITISWQVLDSDETGECMWCPQMNVEFYEEKRPEGVEVEVSIEGDEEDGPQGPDGGRDESESSE